MGSRSRHLGDNLTLEEQEILEGHHWERYANVSGQPLYPPEEHQRVIEKARRLISEHNERIMRPLLESLFEKLTVTEGVRAEELRYWQSQSIAADVSLEALYALWDDPLVGYIALDAMESVPGSEDETPPDSALPVQIDWQIGSLIGVALVVSGLLILVSCRWRHRP